MIIVDTCIFIDHSKEKIIIDDSEFKDYYINSIIQLEFLAGALNKRELKKLAIFALKVESKNLHSYN